MGGSCEDLATDTSEKENSCSAIGRDMPISKKTRKQKGGQLYYNSTSKISDTTVEKAFCGGKTISELRAPKGDDRPLFFIKWAPMASGKSSKRVLTIIQNILQPYALEDCADVSSDKLVENLLPFRYYTLKAKTRNIRMKADMKVSDFEHAKETIQKIVAEQKQEISKLNVEIGILERRIDSNNEKIIKSNKRIGKLQKSITPEARDEIKQHQENIEKLTQESNLAQKEIRSFELIQERYKSLMVICNDFLTHWNSTEEPLLNFLNYILQKQVRDTYQYYYREEKNEKQRTLRDKVVEFFPRAYEANINIIYETAGLGYGEKTKGFQDKLARMARYREGLEGAATPVGILAMNSKIRSHIFKNNFSDFLGEIKYATINDGGEEIKIPVGIEEENRKPQFIPEHYRIVIVFPVVPSEEIRRRGYLRAYYQLLSQKLPVYAVTKEQMLGIAQDMNEVLEILFQGVRGDKRQFTSIINEILTEEIRKYSRTDAEPVDFIRDIENLRDETETLSTKEKFNNYSESFAVPFFRLASVDLEKSITQAFQYSVDYFLRQYIQIGRIEQVIFVNNN